MDALIQIAATIVGIGINAVIALIATWFLPVRRRGLFFCCMIAAAVLATFIASPTTMTAANIAGFLINYIVMPCLFWKGPIPIRLVCGFLLMATQFVAEMLMGVVFTFAGVALDRDAGSVLLLVTRLASAVAILVVGRALAYVVRCTIGRGVGRDAKRGGAAARPREGGVWRYGVFLLPQMAFLVIVSIVLMAYRDTEPQTYVLVLAATAVCLSVDAVALLSFRRAMAAKRDALRAEALEGQLALHAERARAVDAEAERAARFRHDQRNHLQTLQGLIERGQTQRAIDYVRDLRHELAEGRGAE